MSTQQKTAQRKLAKSRGPSNPNENLATRLENLATQVGDDAAALPLIERERPSKGCVGWAPVNETFSPLAHPVGAQVLEVFTDDPDFERARRDGDRLEAIKLLLDRLGLLDDAPSLTLVIGRLRRRSTDEVLAGTGSAPLKSEAVLARKIAEVVRRHPRGIKGGDLARECGDNPKRTAFKDARDYAIEQHMIWKKEGRYVYFPHDPNTEQR